MAYTEYGVNDTLSNKTWSKVLYKAARDSTDIWKLTGKGPNAIIQLKDELQKGAGDKVTFGLRTIPTQDGITEGETAEGNAESLTNYADSVFVNELLCNIGTKSEDTIDQQRVPFNLRDEAKDAHADWWAKRLSQSFFNHACGYTPVSNTKYCGLNAVRGPGTATGSVRHIFAGSSSDDQTVNSATTDVMNLDLIDEAVEAAKTGDNQVQPIMVDGQPRWVFYMHPSQETSLRKNSTAGQWKDIQQSLLAGGHSADRNGILSGALGVYNQCILRVSQDVTNGVHSSTGAAQTSVRRAVLLGRSAACMAIGSKFGPGKFRWNEELMDHKRKLEVSSLMIWGLVKAQFNSIDFGTVVVSTYAAASA